MVIASVLDHGDVAQAMPQGVGLGNRDKALDLEIEIIGKSGSAESKAAWPMN